MKKTLTILILLTCGLGWAGAQEAATALQVAPSDQIKYPDAAQILNKTEAPATKTVPTPAPTVVPAAPSAVGLATAKPLVAVQPVRAAVPLVAKVSDAPEVPAPAVVEAPVWYLRWVVSGDETGVQTWAKNLNREVSVKNLGTNLWEVVSGPVAPGVLADIPRDQAGFVSLVRR